MSIAFNYGDLLNSAIQGGAGMAARGQQVRMEEQARQDALARQAVQDQQAREHMEMMRQARDDLHQARVQEQLQKYREEKALEVASPCLYGGTLGTAGANPAPLVAGSGGAPPLPSVATLGQSPGLNPNLGTGLSLPPMSNPNSPQAQMVQQPLPPMSPETLAYLPKWARDQMVNIAKTREERMRWQTIYQNAKASGGYMLVRGLKGIQDAAEKGYIQLDPEDMAREKWLQDQEDEAAAVDTLRRELNLHPSDPMYNLDSKGMRGVLGERESMKIKAEQEEKLEADKRNAQQQAYADYAANAQAAGRNPQEVALQVSADKAGVTYRQPTKGPDASKQITLLSNQIADMERHLKDNTAPPPDKVFFGNGKGEPDDKYGGSDPQYAGMTYRQAIEHNGQSEQAFVKFMQQKIVEKKAELEDVRNRVSTQPGSPANLEDLVNQALDALGDQATDAQIEQWIAGHGG